MRACACACACARLCVCGLCLSRPVLCVRCLCPGPSCLLVLSLSVLCCLAVPFVFVCLCLCLVFALAISITVMFESLFTGTCLTNRFHCYAMEPDLWQGEPWLLPACARVRGRVFGKVGLDCPPRCLSECVASIGAGSATRHPVATNSLHRISLQFAY